MVSGKVDSTLTSLSVACIGDEIIMRCETEKVEGRREGGGTNEEVVCPITYKLRPDRSRGAPDGRDCDLAYGKNSRSCWMSNLRD